ncbi:hypothetical protein EVAR_41516_1 [Eumeta japonica]|uniref:Uncharacterized protein n=1 Tax=Eumeta variegata TaxID=151549 RepID=A0A4C1X6G1_EUMVA|nr:hypothetical protein EVAR_41516_1 [Eumeta japonica]
MFRRDQLLALESRRMDQHLLLRAVVQAFDFEQRRVLVPVHHQLRGVEIHLGNDGSSVVESGPRDRMVADLISAMRILPSEVDASTPPQFESSARLLSPRCDNNGRDQRLMWTEARSERSYSVLRQLVAYLLIRPEVKLTIASLYRDLITLILSLLIQTLACNMRQHAACNPPLTLESVLPLRILIQRIGYWFIWPVANDRSACRRATSREMGKPSCRKSRGHNGPFPRGTPMSRPGHGNDSERKRLSLVLRQLTSSPGRDLREIGTELAPFLDQRSMDRIYVCSTMAPLVRYDLCGCHGRLIIGRIAKFDPVFPQRCQGNERIVEKNEPDSKRPVSKRGLSSDHGTDTL